MYDEEFTQWATREHSNALCEMQRLESLMEDVSWYQFEISARGWKTPWHTSFPGSVVELYSQVLRCTGSLKFRTAFVKSVASQSTTTDPKSSNPNLEIASTEIASTRLEIASTTNKSEVDSNGCHLNSTSTYSSERTHPQEGYQRHSKANPGLSQW